MRVSGSGWDLCKDRISTTAYDLVENGKFIWNDICHQKQGQTSLYKLCSIISAKSRIESFVISSINLSVSDIICVCVSNMFGIDPSNLIPMSALSCCLEMGLLGVGAVLFVNCMGNIIVTL